MIAARSTRAPLGATRVQSIADLAVDAQPRDAAVGIDVQPQVRPRPPIVDREEVVAVAAQRRLLRGSSSTGAPSTRSGIDGRQRASFASSASIEQCDGKLPVKKLRVDVDAVHDAAHAELRRCTSRGRASRRRRDSQPSIHLPRDVYLPGMKIGGSALTRFAFDAKKSSLVAMARPPTRADARSARVGECRGAMIGATHPSSAFRSSVMLADRASYGKSRIRLVQVAAPRRSPRPARPDRRRSASKATTTHPTATATTATCCPPTR